MSCFGLDKDPKKEARCNDILTALLTVRHFTGIVVLILKFRLTMIFISFLNAFLWF
jgi:hypothetical protein